MKIEVVGYADLDFKDKEGKDVKGTKVHYIFEDLHNTYVVGNSVASVFLNEKISKNIDFAELLDCQCDADFDNNKRIIGIKKI